MLRMTAPFAQRSLGKTKSRFALYAKALSLSLLFLPKGRWHKVPEGISHGFIRFIGGKRIYTAQYIVGLRFPRVMYFCVHSPSESLVLRVLLVSPRFDGLLFRTERAKCGDGHILLLPHGFRAEKRRSAQPCPPGNIIFPILAEDFSPRFRIPARPEARRVLKKLSAPPYNPPRVPR